MGYWHLTEHQQDALSRLVTGKRVLDLGAGDLSLAKHLLTLGASHITAIEPHAVEVSTPQLTVIGGYYQHEDPQPYDVGILSWPWCPTGALKPLTNHLHNCRTVAYLGSNHGGIACGHPALFGYFLRRSLEDYRPDPRNSLIILGAPLAAPRPPVGEEAAGIDTANCYSYPDTIGSRWRDLAGPNWQSHWQSKLSMLSPHT